MRLANARSRASRSPFSLNKEEGVRKDVTLRGGRQVSGRDEGTLNRPPPRVSPVIDGPAEAYAFRDLFKLRDRLLRLGQASWPSA
jgi:hypothetical protein